MLDFPNTPTNGQTFAGPGGIIWQYDGTKWISGVGGNAYAPLNSPMFTGDPQAPTATPGDNDTSVATTAFVANAAGTVAASVTQALNDIGRNKLHNAMFNVQQRGAGGWAANIYNADRWISSAVIDTVNYSIARLTDGSRSQIGDEEADYYLANIFTGSATAGAYNYLAQRIENIRRLAGKTVTVSFWANNNAGPLKVGVNILQVFGTGGSPSAALRALSVGAQVTLSGIMTRYVVTIPIPSIVGKVVGTNGDDYTALELWFSSGASTSGISGNIGVQSGGVALWGVQLEIGSTATPLEKLARRIDIANCQRFFQLGSALSAGYAATGTGIYAQLTLPVQMRATPIITMTGASGSSNLTSPSVTNAGGMPSGAVVAQGTVTTTGPYIFNNQYNASADL